MTQLIDALKKAGLISEEEAEKAKKIKAENEAKRLRDEYNKNKRTGDVLKRITKKD